jgi:hypothetical protein
MDVADLVRDLSRPLLPLDSSPVIKPAVNKLKKAVGEERRRR